MTNENKTETTTEEEIKVDAEDTTEVATEEEESNDDSESTDGDSEDESKAKDTDNEIDYDAELERERKGKPDPKKARVAFKERTEKREETIDEDQPLTRKDLVTMEAKVRNEFYADRALEIAKGMAGNEKEAELIIEKWRNRTFPSHLTLKEQLEEAYVITHRKKILGQNSELKRALKTRDNVNRNPAGTHHEPSEGNEPQIPAPERQAFAAVGFLWNNKSRRYEKKLPNGNILVRDSKTKKTTVVKMRK